MSMPQVHIVAYCGDLGYGVARGAEMLSLMLGFGIVSRIGSGFIADRIGGLRDAADRLGAAGRRAAALPAVRRADLALRHLGAVRPVPGRHRADATPSSCASTSRRARPARGVGIVLMATLFGMALGGWMSGAIFDLTGSYRAAFAQRPRWNLNAPVRAAANAHHALVDPGAAPIHQSGSAEAMAPSAPICSGPSRMIAPLSPVAVA